jgi:preprotein translocase subunit SecA
MRMFASDRVASIMARLKWPDDEPIEAKMVSKAVENAQKQIEELNYERRKNVLKYDEVMNGQREAIYGERRKILEGQDLREESVGFVEDLVSDVVESQCPADIFPEEWDLDGLFTALLEIYPVHVAREQAQQAASTDELVDLFVADAMARYQEKEQAVTPEVMRELERVVLLNITDTKWREHLYEMDYLQEGIHLRALAQKDPITEYRREAYDMFQGLTESIRADFVRYIYRVEFVKQGEEQSRQQAAQPSRVQDNRAAVEEAGGQRAATGGTAGANQAVSGKVPRNAPCPCGSGKKYKKCHGATV